jgi:hypothetical protein
MRAGINIPAALWHGSGDKGGVIRLTQFSAILNDELMTATKRGRSGGETQIVVMCIRHCWSRQLRLLPIFERWQRAVQKIS